MVVRFSLAACLLVCLISASAFALPNTFVQEGLIQNAQGVPFQGEHQIRIRLYTAAQGGRRLYEEVHRGVPFINGYYAIIVGSDEPLQDSFFMEPKLYLGIKIDDGEELTPRTAIMMVPAAFIAKKSLDVIGNINPQSIAINGQLVIDDEGRWVGAPAGLRGPEGPEGPAGPRGNDGDAGANGAAGKNSLIAVSPEPAGANCAAGGQKLEVGLDANENGRLSDDEVLELRYICNGAQGAQGEAGDIGAQGQQGSADTPEQVLNKLTQVDGNGSALDADTIDGFDSNDFALAADLDGLVGTGDEILEKLRLVDGSDSGLDADRLDGKDSSEFVSTPDQALALIKQVDGDGSGLDADRFDGKDSSEFVTTGEQALALIKGVDGEGSGLDADRFDGKDSSEFVTTSEQVLALLRPVDGEGSGVDADRFDGKDSTEFVTTAEQVLALLKTVDGPDSGVDADRIDGKDSTEFVSSGEQIMQLLKPIDGPDSELDTDRFDGLDSTQFLRADQNGILAGNLDLRGVLTIQRKEGPPIDCNEEQLGMLYFDTVEKTFMGCNGEEWLPLTKTASDAPPGQDKEVPGKNCAKLISEHDVTENGVYWIDPDGEGGNPPFKVYCDMDNGGWALLFTSLEREADANEWALSWVEVTEIGKRANNPSPNSNYLLPLNLWTQLDTVQLRSQRTGNITLSNFNLSDDGQYRMTFADTNHNGMNYHNGRPLSTVDRDNDSWGSHCASRGKTFGWYGDCCHLCMTTAEGVWPGGTTPYMPSDWTYRQTEWLRFWGRFEAKEPPKPPENEKEDAGFDCADLLALGKSKGDGIYWIDPDGEGGNQAFKAYCDMEQGGWTLLYRATTRNNREGSWALNWDSVVNIGLKFDKPGLQENYLMPMKHWTRLKTIVIRSDRSGSIQLNNVSIREAGNYSLNFDPTPHDGMNYHRGRALSTVDRDNDTWGNHCAARGKTFGWYGDCCHLCMTTAEGVWPGGTTPYMPSDWTYNQTGQLAFWGHFERPKLPQNTRENPGVDCRQIRNDDPRAPSGLYWIKLDGNDPFLGECDMETDGGGWTKLYGNYDADSFEGSWSLSWDTVINFGLNHSEPGEEKNYLMPMKYWHRFNTARLWSANGRTVMLNNFDVSAPDYNLNFDATPDNGMNYHQGRRLSTVDRDNDTWGSHCAARGKTFGWYGDCCHLCMTTANGVWPGGTRAYMPSDWAYQQTRALEFWAR